MTGPLDRHGSSAVELWARLDAERAGAAFLVYRDAERRQRILLLDRERLTIGRGWAQMCGWSGTTRSRAPMPRSSAWATRGR